MNRTIFALFALVLLAGCHRDGRPEGVLDAPQMVEFLSDAYLLEGFYAVESQYRYDAMRPEVLGAYDYILDNHHVTREQVEQSFSYYAEHPELYGPIQDSVLARIEQVTSLDTVEAPKPASSDFRLAPFGE